MNLNTFETKLNKNELTKDDVRKLLNYAFKMKESIWCIKDQYETDFTEEELNNLEPRDEVIYNIVKEFI